MCTTYPDIGLVIQTTWNNHTSFPSKLKATKLALKAWNKSVFGHAQTKIKHLKLLIHDIQARTPDDANIQLENSLQQDLDEL